jgi:succinyl-diaminopimelate desuccinylase
MASPVVELTLGLVRVDTVNPPGDEAAVADLLGARLEAVGLEVARHDLAPGRPNLVARLAGRDPERPVLSFTGHLDTVPLGRAPWSRDPFGEQDGDRLYGRGTTDMKGGLAAIVLTAERIAQLGPPEAGLEIVLCAGEETGCEGAIALADTPGALGRAGALLVAEPTGNVPCVAHKGMVWVEASTEGRSAHGSAPHLGVNAIYPLARAVAALEDVRFGVEAHPLLGDPTLSVGTIEGGINVNSVPDGARARIDVRTVPGLDAGAVLEALRAAAGPDVALEPWVALGPVETDPADPWVAQVYDAFGAPAEPRGMAYFTDAAALAPAYGGVPTIICGPGDTGQAHQTDEWIEVSRLEAAAAAYVEIARSWCGV